MQVGVNLDVGSKLETRVLVWVGVAALAVRLVYLAEHAGSAFFQVPILDGKFYDTLARLLLEGGDVAGLNPGFRPWLYPLFLALCYRLGDGGGYVLALALQHLAGALVAVLVAALAMRLYRGADRVAAGALAGGLYVLAGPPLFFEGELLNTALFTLLATALLWLLSRADRRTGVWIAAGLVLGLAAQTRPNVLLFAAALPVFALLPPPETRRRRVALAAAALGATLAVLALFGLLQTRLIGSFSLLPGSGGVNFYLGNKTGADGMIPRQDRRVTYGDDYRDSVQVFADELYREAIAEDPDAANVSRYWLARARDEIARDPGRWLALMGRKALFLLWNREIPNNKGYDFVRVHESRLLDLMPVRWWLLLALAVPGALYAARRGDRGTLFWLGSFLTLHGAGVVLFFVNGRYRIPMWPALAVLAAGGILALWRAARARAYGDLAVRAATVAAVAAVSTVNWLAVEPEGFARDFFFRSLAHQQKGRLEAARDDAMTSVALDPTDAAARFQVGNAMLALGDDRLAFKHYLVASSLAPSEPRILNNLGVVLERRGRPDLAYGSYLRALAAAPDYVPALLNAAHLELRAGHLDRAEAKILRAEKSGDRSLQLLAARAFLERDRGRPGRAAALLDRGRRLDRETIDRLVMENRRRLRPGVLRDPASETR